MSGKHFLAAEGEVHQEDVFFGSEDEVFGSGLLYFKEQNFMILYFYFVDEEACDVVYHEQLLFIHQEKQKQLFLQDPELDLLVLQISYFLDRLLKDLVLEKLHLVQHQGGWVQNEQHVILDPLQVSQRIQLQAIIGLGQQTVESEESFLIPECYIISVLCDRNDLVVQVLIFHDLQQLPVGEREFVGEGFFVENQLLLWLVLSDKLDSLVDG